MNRRRIMQDFLDNKSPERVPVGFWYHFVPSAEHHAGLTDPKVLEAVYAGQRRVLTDEKPDFVKIMSDGFFSHPSMLEGVIETVEDLERIQPCGPDHPWITEQIKFVQNICALNQGEAFLFYSLFSPLNTIRLRFDEVENNNDKFARLFLENPEAMSRAAAAIAEDSKHLVRRLFAETDIDGLYVSVQSVQDKRVDRAFHDRYVASSDLDILRYVGEHTENILLHICGYGEFTNPLPWYVDYPAKVVNWATIAEKTSLKEGKKLFGDRPVIGGFDNNTGTLLYEGSKEALKAFVTELLDEAGCKGVAIGADCTIDPSLEAWRVPYIRDVVTEYAKKR